MRTRSGSLCISLLVGLAAITTTAPAQNANQWYGWAQCSVDVQGLVTNGNNAVLGRYVYRGSQTWRLTEDPPSGNVYPITWTAYGSGWETHTGREFVVKGSVGTTLTVAPRASDGAIQVTAGRTQTSGNWARISSGLPSTVRVDELVLPAIAGPPNAVSLVGSSSRYDTAGVYGPLQGTAPATFIDCRWNFSKGAIPPPPPQQVVNTVPPISSSGLGSVFVPITPCRVADTRPTGISKLRIFTGITATSPRTIQIAGLGNSCGIPANGPTALSLNVTAVPAEPLAALYLNGRHLLSANDALPTANAAVATFGAGSIELSSTHRTHAIVDVNGYFLPASLMPAGNAFHMLAPCRAFSGMLAAASQSDINLRTACQIPSTAVAVVLALTVDPRGQPLGYATVWQAGTARPPTSNINASDGQLKTNLAIAQTSTASGSISLFASEATYAEVTVAGYFAPPRGGALLFQPTGGCEIVSNMALTAYSPNDIPGSTFAACGIGALARAYLLNFIATPVAVLTGMDMQPMGRPNPIPWSMYARDGEVTAAAALVGAGTGGISAKPYSPVSVSIYGFGFFE